jgi:rhodanese-related sulfurtransferase
MVHEISVEQLKARMGAGEPPLLIDVREAWELEISQIPGAVHLPMNQIPERLAELDPGRETVIMCHAGGRSLRVAHFLESRGFRSVANLTGGILAWGDRIDPSLRPY